MTSYDSFNGKILDILPALGPCEHFGVCLLCFVDLLQDRGQRPFVALIIVFSLVLLEIVCLFVYGVIGQVHKQIIEVGANRGHVLRCSKSGQTLLVYEDPERGHARDQHVHSQVKLKSIDQVGLVQVPLRYVVLLRIDPVIVARQKDALALATVLWFYYKCFCFTLVELVPKGFAVPGEQPGTGEELKLGGEVLLHC